MTTAPGGANVTSCAMDVPITNTVVSPSSPRKFGTYIFLATYHLANTTGIETLTIRIAQNGSFRKENQENQEIKKIYANIFKTL